MSNPYNLRPPSSASLSEVSARMGGVSLKGDIAPVRNRVLTHNLGEYQLYGNLYRGGRHVFTPPKGTKHPISGGELTTYLMQYEDEPDEEFLARLRDSFTLPYPREIVTIYTATLFRQEVVRDAISEAFGREYVSDIDLQGHSAREFLRRAFTLAQVYGWVGVLTDYPNTSGGYLSAYHERQAGNRPYSQMILPTRLWDWERDPATGDFLYAEIWNGQEGEWDDESQTGGRWRRWFAPDGERSGFWVDVDLEGQILDGGQHSFPRVPLDILICQSIDADDDLEPFGHSALSDCAYIALWLYQMCSLLESHERRALFAFIHIQRDPQQLKGKALPSELHLGNAHYLWTEGNVGWIEPPRSVPEEAREAILWGVQEMRRAAGVATRSEDSVEAHSGAALAWEHSARHNAVYERAQELEDFESRLWRTHAEWLDIPLPPDSVRYPREYAVQPVDQELTEIERLIAISKDLPNGAEALLPMIQRKLRRVAIRDQGHDSEIDATLDALEHLFDEKEPPPAPPPPPVPTEGRAMTYQLAMRDEPQDGDVGPGDEEAADAQE